MEKETIVKLRNSLGLSEAHAIGPDQKREVFFGDSKLVKMIGSNESTFSNSNQPILGTYGIANCVAMIGYNPKTKKAFISHNVEHMPPENINELPLKIMGKEDLEIYLVGNGVKENNGDSLIHYLKSRLKNPNIVYRDTEHLPDPKRMGKSVIFDTRDGKFYAANGFETAGLNS